MPSPSEGSRRRFLQYAGLAATNLFLAACGALPSSPTEIPKPPPPAEPVKVVEPTPPLPTATLVPQPKADQPLAGTHAASPTVRPAPPVATAPRGLLNEGKPTVITTPESQRLKSLIDINIMDKESSSRPAFDPPFLAMDNFLYVNSEKIGRLAKLNLSTGQPLWSNPDWSEKGTPLAVAGNFFWAIRASMDRIYAINNQTGDIEERFSFNGRVANPKVVGQKMYAYGMEYAPLPSGQVGRTQIHVLKEYDLAAKNQRTVVQFETGSGYTPEYFALSAASESYAVVTIQDLMTPDKIFQVFSLKDGKGQELPKSFGRFLGLQNNILFVVDGGIGGVIKAYNLDAKSELWSWGAVPARVPFLSLDKDGIFLQGTKDIGKVSSLIYLRNGKTAWANDEIRPQKILDQDDQLVYVAADGKVIAIYKNGDGFKFAWKYDLRGESLSVRVGKKVGDKFVFVTGLNMGENKQVVSVDAKTGNKTPDAVPLRLWPAAIGISNGKVVLQEDTRLVVVG